MKHQYILLTVPLLLFSTWYSYQSETGLHQLILITSGILLLGLFNNLKKEHLPMLSTTVIIVGLIHASWIFVNSLGYDPLTALGYVRYNAHGSIVQQGMFPITGALDNPSMSVLIPAMAVPVAWGRRWWWAVIALVIAVFLCDSMMGTGAMVVGVAVLYWRWWFLLLPIPAMFLVTRGMWSQRDWLYPRVVDFDGWTWFGHGVGWFVDRFSVAYPHGYLRFAQEHSIILSVYTLLGVFGMGVMVWLLWRVGWKRDPWCGAFVVCMVNSVCNMSWNLVSLSVFGILLYSVVSNIKER